MIFDKLLLDTMNWHVMFLSISIMWFILREFSKRLGEALQMKKYYLFYDLGELLLVVSIVMLAAHFLLDYRLYWGNLNLFPLTAKLGFVVAAFIDVLVAVKYWGWIVAEVLAPPKK